MKVIMCRSCGKFVEAVRNDGTLRPVRDNCPVCSGSVFKDVESGQYIRAG